MIYVNHRINTLKQLDEVPLENGAEIDVRYHNNTLILCHDPLRHQEQDNCTLINFLQSWQHQGPLIVNLKTEGIEKACIELLKQYKVPSWFFLDMSMPFFVKYANAAASGAIEGFSKENLAVRFSEFEAEEYALGFRGKVGWVWVDCFTRFPANEQKLRYLQEQDFKVCLVSPELQGHHTSMIKDFKAIAGNAFDAVCTKHPKLWLEC